MKYFIFNFFMLGALVTLLAPLPGLSLHHQQRPQPPLDGGHNPRHLLHRAKGFECTYVVD